MFFALRPHHENVIDKPPPDKDGFKCGKNLWFTIKSVSGATTLAKPGTNVL